MKVLGIGIPRICYVQREFSALNLFEQDTMHASVILANPERFSQSERNQAEQIRAAQFQIKTPRCKRFHLDLKSDMCLLGAALCFVAGTALLVAMSLTPMPIYGLIGVAGFYVASFLLIYLKDSSQTIANLDRFDLCPVDEAKIAGQPEKAWTSTAYRLGPEANLIINKNQHIGQVRALTLRQTGSSSISIYPTWNFRPTTPNTLSGRPSKCVVGMVTAGHVASHCPSQHAKGLNTLLRQPLNAHLCQNMANNINSLLFPDSQTQVIRAIRHAWDLTPFGTYRKILPNLKEQGTLFVHAIAAIITDQYVYLATAGDCTAHVLGQEGLYSIISRSESFGKMSPSDSEAQYRSGQPKGSLPLALYADDTRPPILPKVIAVQRKSLKDKLLILATPGTFSETLFQRGSESATWFDSFMPSVANRPSAATQGSNFSQNKATDCFGFIRF